jgi:2,3-dihydroxyphenylpropionate 1,2-dioxygenase
VRERLIVGGPLSPEARAARQDNVLREGRHFADGNSRRTPLNPDWDRAFLDALQAGDLDHLASLQDADITRDGGAGGHEVRTWLAAAAALAAAGPYRAQRRYYRPITPWIAGFGVVTAQPA